MLVERVDPTHVRLSAGARDVAALISAARWVAAGGEGRLPAEAVEQLRRIVADYDVASSNVSG